MEKRSVSQSGKKKTTRRKAVKPKQFQTAFDYIPTEGEINEEPSMTVPDMALSVKDLLMNHVRGANSDLIEMEGHFFDMEIPVFEDLTDIQAYKEELERKKQEIEANIRAERDELTKDEREYQKEYNAAVRKAEIAEKAQLEIEKRKITGNVEKRQSKEKDRKTPSPDSRN